MITDSASTTKSPPTIASTISCLVATAIAPSAPPSASEPVSPMNTAAGGALYQRNPSPPPISAATKISDLAGPGHEMHAEVVGEVDPPDHVGDHPERARRDHHRHDRQPVEPVGQVHRVGRADDHQHREGQEEPAEVEQQRP